MIEYGPIIIEHQDDLKWCYLIIDDNDKVQNIKTTALTNTPLSENCTPEAVPDATIWVYDPQTTNDKIYALRVDDGNILLRYAFKVKYETDDNVSKFSSANVLPIIKQLKSFQNGWAPYRPKSGSKAQEVIAVDYYRNFLENVETNLKQVNSDFSNFTKQSTITNDEDSWRSKRTEIDFEGLEEKYSAAQGKLTSSQQASIAKGQGFYLALNNLKSETESQEEYLQLLRDILSGAVNDAANSSAEIVRNYLAPSYINQLKWYNQIAEGEESPTIGDVYDWFTYLILNEGAKYQADFASQTKTLEISDAIRQTAVGKLDIRKVLNNFNADAIEVFNVYYADDADRIAEHAHLHTKVLAILNNDEHYWQARSDLELMYFATDGKDFKADFKDLYKKLKSVTLYPELREILESNDQDRLDEFLSSLNLEMELQVVCEYPDILSKFNLVKVLDKYPKFQAIMQPKANTVPADSFDLDALLIWMALEDDEIIPPEEITEMLNKLESILDESPESLTTRQNLELYYLQDSPSASLSTLYAIVQNLQSQLGAQKELQIIDKIIQSDNQQAVFAYAENIKSLGKLSIFLNYQPEYLGLNTKDLFSQPALLELIDDLDSLCLLANEISSEKINQIMEILGSEQIIALIEKNPDSLISLVNNEKIGSNPHVIAAFAAIIKDTSILIDFLNTDQLSKNYKRQVLENISPESLTTILNGLNSEFAEQINISTFARLINFPDAKNHPTIPKILNQLPAAIITKLLETNSLDFRKILIMLSPQNIEGFLNQQSLSPLRAEELRMCLTQATQPQIEAILSNTSARKVLIEKLDTNEILNLCNESNQQPVADYLFNELITSQYFVQKYISIVSPFDNSKISLQKINNLISLNEKLTASQQKALLDKLSTKREFFESLAYAGKFDQFLDGLHPTLKGVFVDSIISKKCSCAQTGTRPNFSGLGYIFKAAHNVGGALAYASQEVMVSALTSQDNKREFESLNHTRRSEVLESLNETQLNLLCQNYFAFPNPKIQNIIKTHVIGKNIHTLPELIRAIPKSVKGVKIESVEDLQVTLINRLLQNPTPDRIQRTGISLWMIATYTANQKLQNSGTVGQAIREELISKEKASWSVWSINKQTQAEFTNSINKINQLPGSTITQEQAEELSIKPTGLDDSSFAI